MKGSRKLTRMLLVSVLPGVLLIAPPSVATRNALGQNAAANQQEPSAPPTDLGTFVKECMKMRLGTADSQLAIWFPFEFFVASQTAEGKTRAAAEKELAMLKPYQVVIVQCSTERPDGTSDYLPEQRVRARAALVGPDGKDIPPLKVTPPFVTAMAAAMKTMMAAEGDAGGANMHVLIFPNKTAGNQPLASAATKGKMTLKLARQGPLPETVFTWHTPFDAVVPEQPCVACKEPVSAKWSFCAWCGKKASR